MATTYDIFFTTLPENEQIALKPFTFGFASARGVSGPQKMANRFVKCLMTTKGSDPFDLEYGTGFPNLIGSNVTSEKDLQDAVTLFVEDATSKIQSLDRVSGIPDDERLQSANIINYIPTDAGDGFHIYILLRSVSGATLPVVLPVLTSRA